MAEPMERELAEKMGPKPKRTLNERLDKAFAKGDARKAVKIMRKMPK